MKKISKVFLVCITLCTLAFIPLQSSIVGTWTVYTKDNQEIHATFKTDGTYESFNPSGQPAVSGKYVELNDTLAITDEGCGSTWGKYKVTYYGTDSLSLKLINDSCYDRSQNVDGITAKRTIKN